MIISSIGLSLLLISFWSLHLQSLTDNVDSNTIIHYFVLSSSTQCLKTRYDKNNVSMFLDKTNIILYMYIRYH